MRLLTFIVTMSLPSQKSQAEPEFPRVVREPYPLLSDRLSDKPLISLVELIDCLARHNVAVPDSEADRIEEFARHWLSNPRVQLDRLLRPVAILERLYRQWRAAGDLHYELNEYPDTAPPWRNWSGTGQPSKVDVMGVREAMSFLEAISTDALQKYQEILVGKRALRDNAPNQSLRAFRYGPESHWFDCLVFETSAAEDFFRESSVDSVAQTSSQNDANQGVPPRVIKVEEKERRDLLEPAIDQAIQDANNSLKTPEVWLALEKLALKKFAPFMGLRGDQGYKYEKFDSTGEYRIEEFTRDALTARLRRRKKRIESNS